MSVPASGRFWEIAASWWIIARSSLTCFRRVSWGDVDGTTTLAALARNVAAYRFRFGGIFGLRECIQKCICSKNGGKPSVQEILYTDDESTGLCGRKMRCLPRRPYGKRSRGRRGGRTPATKKKGKVTALVCSADMLNLLPYGVQGLHEEWRASSICLGRLGR